MVMMQLNSRMLIRNLIRLNFTLISAYFLISLLFGFTDENSLAGMVFFALLTPFILFSMIANLLLLLYCFVTTRRDSK